MVFFLCCQLSTGAEMVSESSNRIQVSSLPSLLIYHITFSVTSPTARVPC